MTTGDVSTDEILREDIYRKFQIQKFDRKRIVPVVSMTVDLNINKLLEIRNAYNTANSKNQHLTLTHVMIKAIAITLKNFPILYYYFDGKNVVPSKNLKLNVPVAVGNHVEYVVIESPESKSLNQIAIEVKEEVERINRGLGSFYLAIKNSFIIPRFIRNLINSIPSIYIKMAYRYYGNFAVTNFGSFGVKNGVPIISSPIIGVLCLGALQHSQFKAEGGNLESTNILPVTLAFDHRPIDGAYGGNFLRTLKELIEQKPYRIFE